ncbi:MAG TPA: preprotein translocase subunit YajC [Candidatus Acidoferrales bacterium]|nr:preprotein translocase subunit YajC [Candidatus Acidoferrales bacterium]
MISPAWAQAAGGGGPSPLVNFMPLILIFVVFYFLLIRPQQQKQKEHQVMLDNLKVNDEVTTSGGIYGKVTAIADKVVTLEIAPNVRIRVERPQIGSIRGAREEKPQKEKDKPK